MVEEASVLLKQAILCYNDRIRSFTSSPHPNQGFRRRESDGIATEDARMIPSPSLLFGPLYEHSVRRKDTCCGHTLDRRVPSCQSEEGFRTKHTHMARSEPHRNLDSRSFGIAQTHMAARYRFNKSIRGVGSSPAPGRRRGNVLNRHD